MFQKLEEFKLPRKFRGKNPIFVQCWWLVQSSFFALSPQFAYKWRNFLLKSFGAKIGRGVIIRPSVKVTYPWRLTIGDNSWIGDNVELYTLGEIEIGNDVVISQRSYICTGSHEYQKETFDIYAKKITIEDQVWLATDVYIAPGLTVGKGAVIGARSSVFKNMPAEMICIGSPAKPVRHRLEK